MGISGQGQGYTTDGIRVNIGLFRRLHDHLKLKNNDKSHLGSASYMRVL